MVLLAALSHSSSGALTSDYDDSSARGFDQDEDDTGDGDDPPYGGCHKYPNYTMEKLKRSEPMPIVNIKRALADVSGHLAPLVPCTNAKADDTGANDETKVAVMSESDSNDHLRQTNGRDGVDEDEEGQLKRECQPRSFSDEDAPPPTSKPKLLPTVGDDIAGLVRYKPNLLSPFSSSESTDYNWNTTDATTNANTNPWRNEEEYVLFPNDFHKPVLETQHPAPNSLRAAFGSRSPSPIGEERMLLNKKREVLDMCVNKIQAMNQQHTSGSLWKTVLIYNTMRTIQDDLSSNSSNASSSPPSSPESSFGDDFVDEDYQQHDDVDMEDNNGGWGSYVSSVIGGADMMENPMGVGGWPVGSPTVTRPTSDEVSMAPLQWPVHCPMVSTDQQEGDGFYDPMNHAPFGGHELFAVLGLGTNDNHRCHPTGSYF